MLSLSILPAACAKRIGRYFGYLWDDFEVLLPTRTTLLPWCEIWCGWIDQRGDSIYIDQAKIWHTRAEHRFAVICQVWCCSVRVWEPRPGRGKCTTVGYTVLCPSAIWNTSRSMLHSQTKVLHILVCFVVVIHSNSRTGSVHYDRVS